MTKIIQWNGATQVWEDARYNDHWAKKVGRTTWRVWSRNEKRDWLYGDERSAIERLVELVVAQRP